MKENFLPFYHINWSPFSDPPSCIHYTHESKNMKAAIKVTAHIKNHLRFMHDADDDYCRLLWGWTLKLMVKDKFLELLLVTEDVTKTVPVIRLSVGQRER